jgi:hypothetical protein
VARQTRDWPEGGRAPFRRDNLPKSDVQTPEDHMAKYGAKAARKVERAMRERKRGTLRSGRSGRKVTSRKQAIAIGLSQARREGGKVPSRRRPKSRGSRKK